MDAKYFKFSIVEPVSPPSFLTTDTYTWSWLIAEAGNLSLSGATVTGATDMGPNSHDWTGSGGVGPQWDSGNGEIDFTYGDAAGLSVSYTPAAQPFTIYLVIRINTYNAGGTTMLFSESTFGRLVQDGSISQVNFSMGSWMSISNASGTTYGIITVIANTTASSLQWNNETPTVDNAGTDGLEFMSLGYDTENMGMSIKEVITRSRVDDASSIASVKSYLNAKYSLY